MLVDEAQQLGAALAQKPQFAIVICDRILGQRHLCDLLKHGGMMGVRTIDA